MKKIFVSACISSFLITNVFASVASDVNQIRSDNNTGVFGSIIATIFNTTGQIQSEYLEATSLWQENGSNLYYNAGNIGIGTSAPAQKLHVRSANWIVATFQTNTLEDTAPTYNNGLTWIDASGDVTWYLWDLSNTKRVLLTARWSASDYPLDFETGLFTRMRIEAGWNIGIGTDNPTERLEVAGNIKTTGRAIYFGDADQRIFWDNSSWFFSDSNHDTLTQMIFRDKQDLEYWRVYGANNGQDFGLLDWDGNWSYRAEKWVATRFMVNNLQRMTILANGNVWIGTTSPSARLHVAGNVIASNPTASNHLATKSYVDSQVSSAGWASCWGRSMLSITRNLYISLPSAPHAKVHAYHNSTSRGRSGFELNQCFNGTWYSLYGQWTYMSN